MTERLPPIIAEYIRAVNAFDTEAIVATFAQDAYVNDVQREISGTDAIRSWLRKEIVGDRVTMQVREIVDHPGDPIVRCLCDGDYDKTDLPRELVLTHYFRIRDGRIASLLIIFNKPSPY